jgi:haloalkane dehalogenase
MMEKRSKLSMMGQYLLENLGLAKISPFTSDLVKAYDAPFPDPSFKMGPRAMPSHVPVLPDASLDA